MQDKENNLQNKPLSEEELQEVQGGTSLKPFRKDYVYCPMCNRRVMIDYLKQHVTSNHTKYFYDGASCKKSNFI